MAAFAAVHRTSVHYGSNYSGQRPRSIPPRVTTLPMSGGCTFSSSPYVSWCGHHVRQVHGVLRMRAVIVFRRELDPRILDPHLASGAFKFAPLPGPC